MGQVGSYRFREDFEMESASTIGQLVALDGRGQPTGEDTWFRGVDGYEAAFCAAHDR